jgi:hypothetical protein
MALHKIEAGIGKLTLLVFGTIAGALIYSAFKIIPFYYYFYELRNHAESIARVSDELTEEEIRNKMLTRMKELGIPAKPEDLRVGRYMSQLEISLEYREEFYIRFKDKDYVLKVFPFKIDIRTNY